MTVKVTLTGFDKDKLTKHFEEESRKIMLKACEDARREMGAEGKGIVIKPLSTPRRDGHNVTFADISYPSEEIAKKFQAIFQRKMK